MAEVRLPLTMEIVGTGSTEQVAANRANAAYVELVQAFCQQYGFEGDVLAGGAPTAEAVAFTRQRVSAYIGDVVVGYRRSVALAAAETSVDGSKPVLE